MADPEKKVDRGKNTRFCLVSKSNMERKKNARKIYFIIVSCLIKKNLVSMRPYSLVKRLGGDIRKDHAQVFVIIENYNVVNLSKKMQKRSCLVLLKYLEKKKMLRKIIFLCFIVL